jgi:oligoribonuclease NrnB/cAMP/cGMP phosphodiesterase (DHH superfamily)
MICYHHNDLDGRCAGAIVLKAFPSCRMREIDYKDDPDFNAEVSHDDVVYIVDFSFKPEQMARLTQIVDRRRVYWIDHHKTASGYDYGYDFRGKRDFTEPGKSGCELTWEYLFSTIKMPEAVRLLGDYDTWRFDTKEKSMAFQFGMRSADNFPSSMIWGVLLDNNITEINELISNGLAIIDYKDNVSQRILKNHYKLAWEGWSCVVVNTPMIDSNMFKDHEDRLCISWIFTGKEYIVSLRSRSPELCDVSAIAKKYGGGGHKGAAGFVCDRLPF